MRFTAGSEGSTHAAHGRTSVRVRGMSQNRPFCVSLASRMERAAGVRIGGSARASAMERCCHTPSNRADRHRTARHCRRWADPAGRRHKAARPAFSGPRMAAKVVRTTPGRQSSVHVCLWQVDAPAKGRAGCGLARVVQPADERLGLPAPARLRQPTLGTRRATIGRQARQWPLRARVRVRR